MSRIVSLERALEILESGNPIIVIDDENRENEGDLVMPIAKASAGWVNFFITHGRGLLCTPVSESIAQKCGFVRMVPEKKDSISCNFAISIDAKNGISTGISAADRFLSMKIMTEENTKKEDFVQPGHIFPLLGKKGGILERAGHTEASLELCRLQNLPEVAMICEILNEDGTMARLPDLEIFAEKHNLFILSIAEMQEKILLPSKTFH